MARELIPSDATIRAGRPGDERSRLSDGDGLFLQLFVNGGSHGWRLVYRLDGRRRLPSLGTYPDTSLQLARRKADEARALIAEGVDPAARRESERKKRAPLTLRRSACGRACRRPAPLKPWRASGSR